MVFETFSNKPLSIAFGIYAGSLEQMAPRHAMKAVLSLDLAHLSGLTSESFSPSSDASMILPKT